LLELEDVIVEIVVKAKQSDLAKL